jgi:hypothetical protein
LDSPTGGRRCSGGPPARFAKRCRLRRRSGESQLEHRFHERDKIGALRDPHPLVQLWERVSEGQVRQVHGDDLDHVRHQVRSQVSEVGALEVDYADVLAQRAEKLPVARIDSVDPSRTRSEQRTREPACRRAKVKSVLSHGGDCEPCESGLELRLTSQWNSAVRQRDGDVAPYQ